MKPLFAPWRMEFIEGPKEKTSGCILCNLPVDAKSKEAQVLDQGKFVYVVLNKYPYTNGHLMIVPFRHENDWTKLSDEEGAEIHHYTQKALRALKKAFGPDGYNLGVNLGRPAGAGIEEHVHQHIVPRWSGDVNFMPLLAETRVIPEHLETTKKRLLEAWEKTK